MSKDFPAIELARVLVCRDHVASFEPSLAANFVRGKYTASRHDAGGGGGRLRNQAGINNPFFPAAFPVPTAILQLCASRA